MIDSHAHLFFDRFDEDRKDVFERARAAGVEHFVVVGIDLDTSESARELAALHPDVSPTAGIHPNDLNNVNEETWEALDSLLAGGDFVAVGETGLDYHWDRCTPEMQFDGLARHLDLARKHDLPVVIHCRDAWADLLDFLEANAAGSRGVMHCFSGNIADAQRSLALGFDISFAGPLTYPGSRELREAFLAVPEDRFHMETDCPFLPPQGHRGERNEPCLLEVLSEAMAEIRGIPVEDVRLMATRNSRRLFGLVENSEG